MTRTWLTENARREIVQIGQSLASLCLICSIGLGVNNYLFTYVAAVNLAFLAYQAVLMRRLHRKIKETQANIQTLFVDAQYVEISAPFFARKDWPETLKLQEKELAAVGFRRLLYMHNSAFAEAGYPNFTAVYLSADQTMSVSLYFSLWPDPRAEELKPKVATLCLSEFYGPRWVMTAQKREIARATARFYPNPVPNASTLVEEIAAHDQFLSAPPWAAEKRLAWTTTAAFLATQKEQHRYLAADLPAM